MGGKKNTKIRREKPKGLDETAPLVSKKAGGKGGEVQLSHWRFEGKKVIQLQ